MTYLRPQRKVPQLRIQPLYPCASPLSKNRDNFGRGHGQNDPLRMFAANEKVFKLFFITALFGFKNIKQEI